MEYLEPTSGEQLSPYVTIAFDEQQIILHWFNSRIRTFKEPYDMFNHVEFFDNDGDVQATQNDELLDTLFEKDWPMLSMPYVDEETIEWITNMETFDLGGVLPEDFTS